MRKLLVGSERHGLWYTHTMILDEVKEKAVQILKRARVRRASVFGSAARNETDARDVDILVEMERPYGLFKFLTLKTDLEEALGRKVDLVEYSTIKAGIRESALRDAVQIV